MLAEIRLAMERLPRAIEQVSRHLQRPAGAVLDHSDSVTGATADALGISCGIRARSCLARGTSVMASEMLRRLSPIYGPSGDRSTRCRTRGRRSASLLLERDVQASCARSPPALRLTEAAREQSLCDRDVGGLIDIDDRPALHGDHRLRILASDPTQQERVARRVGVLESSEGGKARK